MRPNRPTLKANYRKTIEVILFLIQESENKCTYVTAYDIVKSIFVADVDHLNRYGRPISFDNYYAMKDGPVPSAAYELLGEKRPENYLLEYGAWPLWRKESSPSDGYRAKKFVSPQRPPNMDMLSETDIFVLKEALSRIKAQSFTQTRDMTHEHPAYIDAWKDNGHKNSYLINYELLLDNGDKDVVNDIVQASHYA